MQVGTSKAGLQLLSTLRQSTSRVLPCTCRYFSACSSSFTNESPSLADVISSQKTGPFSIKQREKQSPTEVADYVSNNPKSQRARLLASERRRTVLILNLGPTVTPMDVRRLVNSKVKNAQSVLEVVMLPSPDLRSTGRALVEFDSSYTAGRFANDASKKSGPGYPHKMLQCRLVDVARPPFPLALSDRAPLTLDRNASPLSEDGSVRLGASLAYSGRAVRITGIPKGVPIPMILEKLRQEEFEVLDGPGLESEGRRMDDIVQLGVHPARVEKIGYSKYLVRLPSIAEAHRLVRVWNATWPAWGRMSGESKIYAEVVW